MNNQLTMGGRLSRRLHYSNKSVPSLKLSHTGIYTKSLARSDISNNSYQLEFHRIMVGCVSFMIIIIIHVYVCMYISLSFSIRLHDIVHYNLWVWDGFLLFAVMRNTLLLHYHYSNCTCTMTASTALLYTI